MNDHANIVAAPKIDPAILSPLHWDGERLLLLDQRLLPETEVWLAYDDYREVARAIVDMVVRGAPAIGCVVAFGVALGALKNEPLETVYATLAATRPTAVNLFWALDRMKKVPPTAEALVFEAARIWADDIASCKAIGEHGAALLPEGTVLTHCNAGALATGGFGTALGVIRAAIQRGKRLKVFADETRPFLQGARLTAWELHKSGIDVTVITDGMAAHLMARGEIQSVIVGADRIAANGDVANKIGTYSVALAARHHHLPFFVAAPLSTVDLATKHGGAIVIEERHAREVTHLGAPVGDHGSRRIVPDGVAVRNPSFDVTPGALVSAIITEAGVARDPYPESLPQLFGRATAPRVTSHPNAGRAEMGRHDDRRSAQRIPVELHVAYLRNEDLHRDLITNVSTGGLFIRSSRPLPIGAVLDLEITVAESPAIRVRARVTWHSFPRGGQAPASDEDADTRREEGMGLVFVGHVDARLSSYTKAVIPVLPNLDAEPAGS